MSMDLTMADVRQLTDALEELIHLQHGKEAMDRPSTGICTIATLKLLCVQSM